MDFDSILKKSLAVVNDGFQEAMSELRDVVDMVEEAVKRNAGDRFALNLQEIYNDMRGSTFRIYFDTDINNARAKVIDVLYVRIPSTGYPISHGQFDKMNKQFLIHKELHNKEQVSNEFGELLQNPDSSLIQAIGYALRTEGDEEIPF